MKVKTCIKIISKKNCENHVNNSVFNPSIEVWLLSLLQKYDFILDYNTNGKHQIIPIPDFDKLKSVLNNRQGRKALKDYRKEVKKK